MPGPVRNEIAPAGANLCPLRGVVLSFMLLKDWLIRLEREDSLPRIVVRHLTSEEEHVIVFAEEAYSLGVDSGYEFATNLLRFNYSSMTTPTEVWDYDLASRERTLRKRQEVPSGHDSTDYVTRRLFAPTADGENVPLSLLHRKNLMLDGMTSWLTLWLRRLRYFGSCRVQRQSIVACRSRLRLRRRACARRQREGLVLVSRRQIGQETEHV